MHSVWCVHCSNGAFTIFGHMHMQECYVCTYLTMYIDVGGCSYMYVCIQSTVLCRA